MTEKQPDASAKVFKGNAAIVDTFYWEALLAGVEAQTCDHYFDTYDKAAVAAEKDGQTEQAQLLRFLSVLCSFHPHFGNREEPYKPLFVIENRRGLVPDDLAETDVVLVESLFKASKHPALKARLGDILWIHAKNHDAARTAAENYHISGKELIHGEWWTEAMNQFTRAIQLATYLGRRNEPAPTIVREVQQIALEIPPEERSFRACRLMNVLLPLEVGDPKVLVGRAAQHAKMAGDNYHMARSYWEVEAAWCRAAADKEGARNADLEAAETLVLEAQSRIKGDSPSYFAGTRFLAQGIEALRRVGGEEKRIGELKKQLLEWQRAAKGEMQSFSVDLNLTDAVRSAREHVSTDRFDEAVIRLALGQPLVSVPKLKEDVLKSMKKHPLLHIFKTHYVDDDGRVLDIGGGMMDPASPEFEKELESQMFQYATSFIWGVRAEAFIEPGRHAIWEQHHPRLPDMGWLVQNHPLVPRGHEVLFARGLLAGFDADYPMAVHFLVPQIENLIRHTLQMHEVDVANLMSDLTQPLKVSAQILCHPKTREIFGEDMAFELRGLLIEKRGFQLRHRLAHGMISVRDCYSPAAANVWWLVLRLCVIGFMKVQDTLVAEKCSPRTPGT